MQIVFWLGVIMSLPAFYRFAYATSSLIWRKIFPTRKIRIQLLADDRTVSRSVTIQLDRNDGRRIVDIIDAALSESGVNQGHE